MASLTRRSVLSHHRYRGLLHLLILGRFEFYERVVLSRAGLGICGAQSVRQVVNKAGLHASGEARDVDVCEIEVASARPLDGIDGAVFVLSSKRGVELSERDVGLRTMGEHIEQLALETGPMNRLSKGRQGMGEVLRNEMRMAPQSLEEGDRCPNGITPIQRFLREANK